MPVTEKQLIANRRNALKSTGPKTPFGKFRSSRNALQHGHYSKFNLAVAFMRIPAKDRAAFYHFSSTISAAQSPATAPNCRNTWLSSSGALCSRETTAV